MTRRSAILTTALAVLWAAPAAARAAPAAVATLAAAAVAVQPAAAADVGEARRRLLDPDTPDADRDPIAQRLAAAGGDAAVAALGEALAAGRPAPVQRAAAAALAATAAPDPRLAAPLLALLRGDGPPNVLREAGRALGGYDRAPGVLDALTAAATGDGPIPLRQAAVAGLARLPNQVSAAALVSLLDGDAPEPVEQDAAEALRQVTGLDLAADDLAGWAAWWDRAGGLAPAAFEAELLRTRSRAAEAERRRAAEAEAAVYLLASQAYRRLDRPAQTAMLVDDLQSPSAAIRDVGARLALDDASFAQTLAPPVKALIRAAVGDPDERVRTTAAKVLQRGVDPAARDALLAQVVREPSASARQAQVDALAELRDSQTLGVMLALVDDPSAAVRRKAAAAAAALAADGGERTVVRRTAETLKGTFDAADARTQAGRRERRDLLGALSRLGDPSLLDFYVALLTRPPRPSPPVRAAALRGLATIGSDRVGDIVVTFLSDDDPRVREQAVRAVGATSLGFSRADTLRLLTREGAEADAGVRRAAWETLLALFDKASVRQLAPWPGYLREQPERRLAVLEVLVAKATGDGDADSAASWQQESGDVLLNDLDRPADAATAYRAALRYSLSHPTAAATIKARTESVLTALLRARDFAGATSFAGGAIRRDPGSQEDVGRVMKQEANRLAVAKQAAAARSLIEAALRMDPPLSPRIAGQLRDILGYLPAGG